MVTSRLRGRVAIITSFWGETESERVAIVRQVAGALALQFEVDVLYLNDRAEQRSSGFDSVFALHTFPLNRPQFDQRSLLRLALSPKGQSTELPDYLQTLLDDQVEQIGSVNEQIDLLNPDAVILCGELHPYDLDRIRGEQNRRIVFLPMSEMMTDLHENAAQKIAAFADQIIVTHPGEERVFNDLPRAHSPRVASLDLALSINRAATADTLFGVRFFQPFVLLIRNFPPGGAQFDHDITHEIITAVAGRVTRSDLPEESWRFTDDEIPDELPISVAEVDGESWILADNVNMLPLPVNPSRVNLWRLMAHALFTIDLRPTQTFGRETIESLMFDTPVIVPDGSAAMEHARKANAGLWFRNNGELLDCVRIMTDRSIRDRFARNGRDYVNKHHQDMDGFVERICELVLPRAEDQRAS